MSVTVTPLPARLRLDLTQDSLADLHAALNIALTGARREMLDDARELAKCEKELTQPDLIDSARKIYERLVEDYRGYLKRDQENLEMVQRALNLPYQALTAEVRRRSRG